MVTFLRAVTVSLVIYTMMWKPRHACPVRNVQYTQGTEDFFAPINYGTFPDADLINFLRGGLALNQLESFCNHVRSLSHDMDESWEWFVNNITTFSSRTVKSNTQNNEASVLISLIPFPDSIRRALPKEIGQNIKNNISFASSVLIYLISFFNYEDVQDYLDSLKHVSNSFSKKKDNLSRAFDDYVSSIL